MTYGYNTHLTLKYIGNLAQEITLYDIARDLLLSLERSRRQEPSRPILFISHSLGGLVVKDMLRYADHNKGDTSPHLDDLVKSTVGLMFFGTPHLGADPRSLFHRQVEGIARLVLKVNDNIVRTLWPNSENARRLQDEFVPLVQKQKWTVHSFQEAHNNRVLGKQVVDHGSSCLGMGPPLETREDINRDHSGMCRFTGPSDPEYQKVVAALQRMNAGLVTRSQKRNGGARPLSEEEHQALLDSLHFDQIHNRLQSVKAAYAATCRWFIRHPAYLDWQDPQKASEHDGFLWLKGKQGAGKSTLMKFALASHRKSHGGGNIASFFFNARGAELERTTVGMYRSLIVQLLEMLPRLRCAFDDADLKPWNALGSPPWSIELLKEVFGQLVQGLEPSEPVTCFIDALDECSRDEIRDMVEFFEGLMADRGVDQGTFRVVFSSRYYLEITTSKAVSLVLETQEEHSSDIKKYVNGRLNIKLRTDVRDQIVLRIEEKASGVFMWVVLVVDILNKAHLDWSSTVSDKHELLLCLQWIFFARRPLSPDELYCGILAGAEPMMLGKYDTGNDGVKRFILNASKGLAEMVDLKKGNTIVQFIHESVRDFLLKEGGLGTLWLNLGDDFDSQSHDALKDCCITYIELDLPEPEADPFLQYAVHSVLWHADNAAAGGIRQGKFLEGFPRERWVNPHNLHEKQKNRRYSMSVSLMYILAAGDLGALIKTHMVGTSRSGLEREEERVFTPLFTARATKSQRATQVILQEVSRTHLDSLELEQLCQQFLEEKPTL
ncbi:hypothetical protein DL546_008242 [Coniochaeta pulveracea]|nr:hypothetical protein DL546_008242 [Coniochaeta pulveracea]